MLFCYMILLFLCVMPVQLFSGGCGGGVYSQAIVRVNRELFYPSLDNYGDLLKDTAPFFSLVGECINQGEDDLLVRAQAVDRQVTLQLTQFVQGRVPQIDFYFPVLMSYLAIPGLHIAQFEDLIEMSVEELMHIRSSLKQTYNGMQGDIMLAGYKMDIIGRYNLCSFQYTILTMYEFFDELIKQKGFGSTRGI